MQSTRASPLAMLATTSSLSASLVNKLQVNRAAQHFADFIPLFLNTAQMWLAHQPDYLQKDSRRRLPGSFPSLEILLRLKGAFTGARGGAEGSGEVCEGKAAPSLSASSCHPSSTSHAENWEICPFLDGKGKCCARSSPKHPVLASCATFRPLLSNYVFHVLLASFLLCWTLVQLLRHWCSQPVWTKRHMGVLWEHTLHLQRYLGLQRPEICLFWIQWADSGNTAQHLHFHLGNGEEIWTDIWESLFLYFQHWWMSIWIFNSHLLSSESTEFAPCGGK